MKRGLEIKMGRKCQLNFVASENREMGVSWKQNKISTVVTSCKSTYEL